MQDKTGDFLCTFKLFKIILSTLLSDKNSPITFNCLHARNKIFLLSFFCFDIYIFSIYSNFARGLSFNIFTCRNNKERF